MTLASDKAKDMARVFHSLSNETRLRIMALLIKGELNVTEICRKLRLTQTTVSGHLRLLRLAGLVMNRRDGYHIYYSISDLSKHPLGLKSTLTKRGSNAAKLGIVELAFPKE